MLHHLFSLTLVALLSSVLADNTQVSVNLRIEGTEKTIFEGSVLTRGHDVTTTTGGTHHCDGTNNEANPSAGPTCISALDDASKSAPGFSYDGAYLDSFDDFFISTIDGNAQTDNQFWAIFVNFQATVAGGCEQQIKADDEVLFAFDGLNKAHLLKLTGPQTANVDSPIVITVTDAQSGNPVAGADVNGQISDDNGHVSLTFAQAGTQNIKAEKSDSVRSSRLTIEVN